MVDWTSALRTVCKPTEEWPREVSSAASCFGHRVIAVSRADTRTVYFYSAQSGALTGVLERYSSGTTRTLCRGEVPAGEPDTCAMTPACSH